MRIPRRNAMGVATTQAPLSFPTALALQGPPFKGPPWMAQSCGAPRLIEGDPVLDPVTKCFEADSCIGREVICRAKE